MSINMRLSAILLVLGLGMFPVETVLQPGTLSSPPSPSPNSNANGLAITSKHGMGRRQFQPRERSNCAWHHYGLRIRFPLPTWSHSDSYIILSWTSGKANFHALSVPFEISFESRDVL